MTKKEIDNFLMKPGTDSYNRFRAFFSVIPKLKKENYWYALRHAYEDSDNLFNARYVVLVLFASTEPCRYALMDKAERAFLKSLPNEVEIFRGMTIKEYKSGNFGISWTLKEDIAKFFATQYGRNHSTKHLPKTVHNIIVDKKDIVAFLNGRNEFEIIILPAYKRERQA